MSNVTVRVQFGASTSASDHLSAVVDDRAAGPNAGKTSFLPGDTAWFLVHRSEGIELKLDSSAGSIVGGNEVTLVKTEDISFENSAAGSLPVPAKAITSVLWIGRSLGGIKLGGDGLSLTADESGVAIARITYTCRAVSYGLVAPDRVAGLVDFDVLVLITGSRPTTEVEEDA
ncbi:hypothetical protein [Azospira sp.]|uniref:hypothetical protein n=1 Tax=Azospira sp. TaxID=1872671 RepID=UPI002565A6BE|nr:hypothetical protein [Azospira sp.]MDK9690530.1 hypothetical protein [Azospira sp.]